MECGFDSDTLQLFELAKNDNPNTIKEYFDDYHATSHSICSLYGMWHKPIISFIGAVCSDSLAVRHVTTLAAEPARFGAR